MKIKALAVFTGVVFLFATTRCTKDTTVYQPETDEALYAKAIADTGFTFYKNTNALHISSSEAAHGAFFRIRFNAIASAALTDNGKLPNGGTFPVGSLIVKELHGDTLGTPFAYAVMEKLPMDPNAANGWVWAEYFAPQSGTLVKKRGDICTGCHSASNRDYARVFEIFP